MSVKRTNEFFSSHKKDILIVLGLALIIWFSRWLYSETFGLYADDISDIPNVISMNLEDLFERIGNAFRMSRRARPLQFTLIYILAFAGWKTGDMQGLYGMAYLISILNTILFYMLLRRTSNQRMAIIGGLAFALFPADTTQTMLMNSFGLHTSVTFVLAASHFLLSRKYVPAYLFAFLSIITYETPFTVFMVMPLLLRKWNKKIFLIMGRHLVITGSMLAGSYLVKRIMGDQRMADMSTLDLARESITHMVQGPLVSLGTYGYRVIQVTQSRDFMLFGIVFVGVLLLGILFYFLFHGQQTNQGFHALREMAKAFKANTRVSGDPEMIFRHIIGGAAALAMAYPLTLTVRPYALSGRDTRVHMAAVIGAAVVVAALVELLFRSVTKQRWKFLLTALVAVEFGYLVGFGILVQRDYRLAWQYQKDLLRQVIELVPDLEDGVVILIEPSGLYDTRHIDANTWNLVRVLEQVYQFPPDWDTPPRMVRLSPGWEKNILTSKGRIVLNGRTVVSATHVYGEYDASNVILLLSSANELSRAAHEFPIDGSSIMFKQFGEAATDEFKPGPLYDLMLHEKAE